jgi:DNA-binding IclR family transcriptional regulator
MDGDDVPVRSVARALDLITALEDGPQTLGVLAASSHLSKGTAHRLLATLASARLVIQDPATATYALGPGCFAILDAVAHGAGGLDVLARSILAELSASTAETVALYVRAGPQRVCVAQAPSPQPVRYTAHLGMENPVNTGAMGKVLLAFSDPRERREILDRLPLRAWTPASITDRPALERELDAIVARGFATSRGEQSVGVAAISVPVFDPDRRVLAALSVLGPDDRMPDRVMALLVEPLRAAAAKIEQRLVGLGSGAHPDID